MKIHQVTMTGFGPFRDPQTVDLDAFADHGTFLIAGRTGAGKSSILDAIVYALYDSAPRYERSGGKQLRSDYCSPEEVTRVELIFSTVGRRYRVTRSPEFTRPKSRGEGFTTEKATAQLDEWVDGQWVGLESQLRTVGQRLAEILPLTSNQFLQVVLLAQGQFQKFLVASSEDRQGLLRTLFGSDRFRDFDTALQRQAAERRRDIELADAAITSTVAALAEHVRQEVPDPVSAEWLLQILDECQSALDAVQVERDAASGELETHQAAFDAAKKLAERQQRLADVEQRLAALDQAAESVGQDRTRRDAATAARSVEPAFKAQQNAARDLQAATSALESATLRLVDITGTDPSDDLESVRDALAAQVSDLKVALDDERKLASLQARVETVTARLEAGAKRVDELEVSEARLIEAQELEIAVSSEKAEADLAAVRDEREQAARLARVTAELAEARETELDRGRARTAASAALDALRQRQLAEYAGTLGARLVEGEACAVCGSVDHPEPAVLKAEAVTEDMLDVAESELAAAEASAQKATSRAAELRGTVAELGEMRSVEQIDLAVTEATAVLAAAVAAEKARDHATASLAKVRAELQALTLEQATLAQERGHADEQVGELHHSVTAARGDAESIAERLDSVTAQLDATRSLIQATATHGSALTASATSADLLAEQLELNGLDDVESFLSARSPESELQALDQRVRRFDDALAAATAAQASAELQDLPTEPADVDGTQALLLAARARHDETVSQFATVEAHAATARSLASRIESGWQQSEAARKEFEVVRRLASSVHGDSPNTKRMRLESYVLGAELHHIVEAANVRLRVMSANRYELLHSDTAATRGNNAGLEVRVLDQHTGETRAPESLSGGEKFLASLALALGLAEVVTNRAGGITLDTLFIDEGFGSLDPETLDIAMHTLDGLRENGRTVGLISHVETMKERIPAQLAVEQTPGGWSKVAVRV